MKANSSEDVWLFKLYEGVNNGPTVNASSISAATSEDVTVEIDPLQIAQDPDGDALFVQISNAQVMDRL